MYYLAKIAEATGLTIVLVAFVSKFPDLMSHQVLMLGILIFIFGILIENFLLNR